MNLLVLNSECTNHINIEYFFITYIRVSKSKVTTKCSLADDMIAAYFTKPL